ncbi:MAG TPA: hypothetical protein VHE35_01025, partial [Kofleriaceae bacterium]|nr:hypothetical protein [Kofleriaceae bacterium]
MPDTRRGRIGRRIGVVTTSYPRWPGDAAGGFVAGHVDYLRATGAEVEVVAVGEREERGARAAAGAEASRDGGDAADARVTRVDGGRLFYRGGAPDMLEAAPWAAPAALAVGARLIAEVARRA